MKSGEEGREKNRRRDEWREEDLGDGSLCKMKDGGF